MITRPAPHSVGFFVSVPLLYTVAGSNAMDEIRD